MQGDLEEAVAKPAADVAPTVVFAGRTDAGVHASGAVAHVDLERTDKHGGPLPPFTEAALLNALNHHLGERIGVASVRCVPASVHARYSASMRTYVYQIRCAAADAEAAGEEVRRVDACRCCPRVAVALDSHRVFVVDAPLDVAAMRAAAAVLLGTTSRFRAASCGASRRCAISSSSACSRRRRPRSRPSRASASGTSPFASARNLSCRTKCDTRRHAAAGGAGQITATAWRSPRRSRQPPRADAGARPGLFLARVDYPEASYVASTAPPPRGG